MGLTVGRNRAKNFEYSYLYLKPSHVSGENFKMTREQRMKFKTEACKIHHVFIDLIENSVRCYHFTPGSERKIVLLIE